jgi:antitoxin (DNA-binding transcriptional repressor) of toxin-antitoxin stability system
MNSKRAGKQADVVRETTLEYRVSRRLSATEAARGFSELLNRVRYKGETFIIERGGVPVCELRPVSPFGFTGDDWISLMKALPRVDDDYLAAVEEVARQQPVVPESAWDR